MNPRPGGHWDQFIICPAYVIPVRAKSRETVAVSSSLRILKSRNTCSSFLFCSRSTIYTLEMKIDRKRALSLSALSLRNLHPPTSHCPGKTMRRSIYAVISGRFSACVRVFQRREWVREEEPEIPQLRACLSRSRGITIKDPRALVYNFPSSRVGAYWRRAIRQIASLSLSRSRLTGLSKILIARLP